MIVTASEFKFNFDKYLDILEEEDIFITRDGKMVAKLVNSNISAVDSLRGILKDVSGVDLDSIRAERIARYENNV